LRGTQIDRPVATDRYRFERAHYGFEIDEVELLDLRLRQELPFPAPSSLLELSLDGRQTAFVGDDDCVEFRHGMTQRE
jgi:hypothetical protein